MIECIYLTIDKFVCNFKNFRHLKCRLPFCSFSGPHKCYRRTYPGDMSKLEPSIWKSAWKGVFETEGEGKCKEGKFSTQTVCFESLVSNVLALDYLPVP